MTETPRAGPVLIDLGDEAPPADPAAAPPVPDLDPPEGVAMRDTLALARREGSALARWALGAAAGLVILWLGLAAWDWALALVARVPVLGGLAWVLLAVVALGLLVALMRELVGWRRLRRLDSLRREAEAALASGDLDAARDVARKLAALYGGAAPDLAALDADALIEAAERRWLTAADAAARAEVEASARRVALLTAMVPLALADVAAALILNMRMLRRIATIYGGRPGALGSWRLIRAVAAHLAATGAVAVGDDMLGSALGGGLLSKLSRRFGEGIVNGALTARVGVSAMDVCRPLPFRALPRPGVSTLTARALGGLFQRG